MSTTTSRPNTGNAPAPDFLSSPLSPSSPSSVNQQPYITESPDNSLPPSANISRRPSGYLSSRSNTISSSKDYAESSVDSGDYSGTGGLGLGREGSEYSSTTASRVSSSVGLGFLGQESGTDSGTESSIRNPPAALKHSHHIQRVPSHHHSMDNYTGEETLDTGPADHSKLRAAAAALPGAPPSPSPSSRFGAQRHSSFAHPPSSLHPHHPLNDSPNSSVGSGLSTPGGTATPPQFIFAKIGERKRAASHSNLVTMSRQSTKTHHNGPLHDLRRFLNDHIHHSASGKHLDKQGRKREGSETGGEGSDYSTPRSGKSSPRHSNIGTPSGAQTPHHEKDFTNTALLPSTAEGRNSPPLGEDHAHLQKKYGKWGKILGSGAGGTVRLIKRSKDHTVYAVKEFRAKRQGESEREYVKKVTAEFCVSFSRLQFLTLLSFTPLPECETYRAGFHFRLARPFIIETLSKLSTSSPTMATITRLCSMPNSTSSRLSCRAR